MRRFIGHGHRLNCSFAPIPSERYFGPIEKMDSGESALNRCSLSISVKASSIESIVPQ